MPTLDDTQHLLWRLITAPEGVAAALAADADRGGSLSAALAEVVRSDGALDAPRRLDIYANMYFFRILDVLKEDYPATRALLGDTAFHNFITDYLLRHPPEHFSMREAGRRLPELLATHDARTAHPCAADLACFERALNDAFDAADAQVLDASALAARAPEQWASLRLALHPSVHLLTCAWPVHTVRAAVDRGESASDPSPGPTPLCVWRQDLTVFHRLLDEVDFAALQAVSRGVSFGDVCAVVCESVPADAAPAQVAAAVARWLANGGIYDRLPPD